MNRFLLLWCLLMLSSCVTVKKYNQHLITPIAPEKLQQDVDFIQLQLQKNHPHLHDYISEEELNDKFDSLKKTVTKPLTPPEFYKKLAPVVAAVRQGHLNLYIPSKRLNRKEIKNLKKQKGLFSRYNFLVDTDRLYVKDNVDKIPGMEPGTELLEINGERISVILQRYRPFITSDGYNTTFQNYALARRWAIYFTVEQGILDRVHLKTKYRNAVNTFYLTREKQSQTEKKAENRVTKQKKQQKTKDYNAETKTYNRSLNFIKKDSSVAVMTIKTFSGIASREFYREHFKLLSKAKTKSLIIDLRNNLGGSLGEIQGLYRYLGADEYPFINNIEVTSPTALLNADYIRAVPIFAKPLAVITWPVYALGSLLSVYKKENHFYLRNNAFTLKKSRKDAFLGKIYVLINGSSFSASSILAAKLKGDGRAVLIGEETGGANDGTVAGRYNTQKLPHSKIEVPIGLMFIQPNIALTNTKKGVVPDVKLLDSKKNILDKKDLQMQYILEQEMN